MDWIWLVRAEGVKRVDFFLLLCVAEGVKCVDFFSSMWIFFLLELHIGVKAKQEGSDDHDFGLRRFGFEVSVSVPDRDTK